MNFITIGDVSDIVSKGTTPTSIGLSFSENGIPFLRGEDVLGKAIDFPKASTFISKESHKLLKRSELVFGDVLITIAGTIGRIGYISDQSCIANCNQAVAFVRADDEKIDPEWLCYILQSPEYQTKFSEFVVGGAIPNVSLQQIRSIEIPSVPIEKQRQIAARLKAQLAEVDKARQAAEAQLQDAHTLYAVILKETFLNEASKAWPRIELGEVGDVVAGVTLGRKTNGKATRPIPYLRVANVKDGHLDLSDVSIIDATDHEIKRLLLQPGDILLTEGGDPDKLGRGTFWSGELEECIHQNHIFRVRFPSDLYLPEFIAAQIGSAYGKDYFFAHAKKTTGIATINQKVLKSFPVLSPPIEAQKGVLESLSSRLDNAVRIIQAATKQLNDINLLPQKILAQAFEM